MPDLRVPDLIAKKRDGHELTDCEVASFIDGVVQGQITDAQTGAMLMAIFLNGLSDSETVTLTDTMLHSGQVLRWPETMRGRVADKHSTGGVGDKSSLILTPALAACGLKVPMITGRGLGHTGGTLDKLDAIPNIRSSFTMEHLHAQIEEVGAFIVGPTDNMVPADKILYATRDTTGTVENKSLIAASIMSKKAAENLDALVLQLTFGKAAFMKTEQDARRLGQIIIDIGKSQGIKTTGLLMQMSDPLGKMIGNSLEVAEAVHCLNGDGPADLHQVVCKLGGQLLMSTGVASSAVLGEAMIDGVLRDGSARTKFIDIVTYQGADRNKVEALFKPDANLSAILPCADDITHIIAQESGYIHAIDALACGTVAHQLGAGRTKPGDSINLAVGVELMAQVGDFVNKGDIWAKVHHDTLLTPGQLDMVRSAVIISTSPPPAERLQRITGLLQ